MTEVSDGAAATARALELAYGHLDRRARTVDELRRHLLGHDLDASAVEAALDELIEGGYLDDTRYAQLFAQDKRELEQWGSGRIRRALLGRGIDRDVVEAALAAGDGGLDRDREFDQAVALLRRRFPHPPRDRREQQRALGILLRKGYEPELAIDALTAYRRGHV